MKNIHRTLLGLGIQHVAHRDASEPIRFGRLPFVVDLTEHLAVTLSRPPFSYRPRLIADPLADTINTEIGQALKEESAARILYIIGHGLDDRNDLLIVGSDGLFSEPINQWTREPSLLLKQQEECLSTPTLFILDCCSAGTAIMEQLLHSAQGEPNSRWVIAAATSGQAAFDGRLSEAFVAVLGRIARGELDIDSSWPHIPYMQLAREIRYEMTELTGFSPRQVLRITPVEMDDPGSFPFFNNPAYIPVAPGVKTPSRELVAFLDSTAFDQKHWRLRASGGAQEDDSADGLVATFTGRRTELRQLADFCQREGPGLLFLTGSPGSGKSAILGQLVCNAHKDLHDTTSQLWLDQKEYLPGVVTSIAVVHARQQSVYDIIQSVSDQLLAHSVDGPGALIQELLGLVTPPLLIIDALDEARIGGSSANGVPSSSDIVDSFLVPLATAVRADGKPVAFVVVGARRWVGGVRLAERLAMPHRVIDLDRVPDDRLRAELQVFSEKRLRAAHMQWSDSQITNFTTALAARLAAPTSVDGPPKSGSFLAVSLFIASVISSFREPQELQSLLDLADQAPQNITELLAFDIERRPAAAELGTMLAAVALVKGKGAPLEIIRRLARALGDVDLSPGRCKEILTEELSFYLRTSADVDGSVLYRLFHQEVSDAVNGDMKHPVVPLHELLQDHPSSYEWSNAEPYLRRHAVEHAADTDAHADVGIGSHNYAVSGIWSNVSFLIWAVPSFARRYPPPRHTPQYRRWELHRRAALQDDMLQAEIALLVAVQAAKASDKGLVTDLLSTQGGQGYWPSWGAEAVPTRPAVTEKFPVTVLSTNATAVATSTAYNLTFTGTIGGKLWVSQQGDEKKQALKESSPSLSTSIMSLAVLDSITSVVIGGYDGNLTIWNWIRNSLHEFPHLHSKRITGIAGVDHEDYIATTDIDGWMRLWRLDTRELVGEKQLMPGAGITALAGSRLHRSVFVAATDRSIQHWDLRSEWRMKGRLAGSLSAVTAIATTFDERILVTGSADGSIRRWDLNNLVMVGEPNMDLMSSIRYLDVRPNGITLEARDEDQRRLLLNLYTGESSESPSALVADPGLSVVLNCRIGNVLVVGGSRSGNCYKIRTGQPITTFWFASSARVATVATRHFDGNVTDTDFWKRPRYNGAITAACANGDGWVTGDGAGRLIQWSRVAGPYPSFSGDAWEPAADANVQESITGVIAGEACVVFSTRSRVGVWENDGGFYWVVELPPDEATKRLPLAWLNDQEFLYASVEGGIWAWSCVERRSRLIWSRESGCVLTSIYVDRSEQRIWVGDYEGYVHAVDVARPEVSRTSARFSKYPVVALGLLGVSAVCVFADGVIAVLDESLGDVFPRAATLVPCPAADVSEAGESVVFLDGNEPLMFELSAL